MKRYSITMDVIETYEVFIDAEDEEEACDLAYEMDLDDIRQGTFLGEESEIVKCEEVQFSKDVEN